jgi:hypothetical protein
MPSLENINKKTYIVKAISLQQARILVEQNHYAKSATNTRVYTHGLFHIDDLSSPIGVAWWLPPTKNAAIVTFPEGDWKSVLSLTRLAIIDNAPRNSASFLLMGSVKLIDYLKWKCLVTYADTWRNHTGAIYKACNWEYLGMTKPSPVYVNQEGLMMGRKRGAKNLTVIEMNSLGFKKIGSFPKHKFRYVFNKTKQILEIKDTL